jgi:hypothetical protein
MIREYNVYRYLINQYKVAVWILTVMGITTTTVFAAHFQQPEPSTISCDFYSKIKINGISADISDEVAFFDPQGTICGLFIVTQKAENAIIHVYGDILDTRGIDEGATEQDILSIRMWDASESKEYAGSDMQLSAMSPVSEYFKSSAIPPVWRANKGFTLSIDTKRHFQPHYQSTLVCNYIGNLTISDRLAKQGDEVGVFDPSGILCGSVRIQESGKYGMLHVYGDNPDTTDIDEGAMEADQLTFKVWDNVSGVEIQADHIALTPGEAIGSFISGSVPPVWTNFAGYHLNLSADYHYQSVSLNPASIEMMAGKTFEITAIYQVSDGNTQLEGVSLRLYYDSSKLSYVASEYTYQNQLLSINESPVQDTLNSDNDSDTDQFITIQWKGENWPNQDIPLILLKSVFSIKNFAMPGVTHLNSQCVNPSSGYYGGYSRTRVTIINPAATIYGSVHYLGESTEGTYFMGAWDANGLNNWRTTKPVRLFQCDQQEFLIRLTPGKYIFAAYKDLDHEGQLSLLDIDDNEPYGFYSENPDPAFQNMPPVAVEINSGDIKACQITIYDWPVIQSFNLSKENIPPSYPSHFPTGNVLKAIVSIAYGSKVSHIQKVEINGPNMDTVALSDTGILPDTTDNDRIFSSWIQPDGIIAPGPYTVTVIANELIVEQTKTIDMIDFQSPVILEPGELASTVVTFKWQPLENAHHYQLFLLNTSEPEHFSDYLLIKPFIETNQYIPTFQELSLGDGITYYFYVTAVDEQGLNLSYSNFQSFKTDDADPSIIAIERKPSGTVKAGAFALTIVFSERMDTSILPSVLWTPGDHHLTGIFSAPNIWAGTTDINDGDDGLKTIHISDAFDMAGNRILHYTRTFLVDTLLPDILDITLEPGSPVTQGSVTFTIHFSEIMDINQLISVNFGKYQKSIFGNFITNDAWSGSYHITKGYDGIQTISVSGGYDLAGNAMKMNNSNQFIVDTTPPATPAGFTGERVDYQVNLSWQANSEPDFKGYNIYRDGKRINPSIITQTHFSEIIVSGKTYIYAVTAQDNLGLESPFSQTYAVTSECTPPEILHPVSGSSLTVFQINVRGKAEPGAIVDIMVNQNLQQSAVAKSNGDFSLLNIPIIQGENTITAISTNTYGVKSESSVPVIVINDPVPGAPKELELTASDTIITLTWQPNEESDIAGYNIYRHLGRQKRRLNDLTVTETTFIDNHLTNGRNYIYSITAIDTNGSEGLHSTTIQGTPVAGEKWAVGQ